MVSVVKFLVEKFADQLLDDGPVLPLECPSKLPLVLADIDRTEQVLVNLLGNPVDHITKRSITVRIWAEVSHLWIAVIDTGVGIAKEDLPYILSASGELTNLAIAIPEEQALV